MMRAFEGARQQRAVFGVLNFFPVAVTEVEKSANYSSDRKLRAACVEAIGIITPENQA